VSRKKTKIAQMGKLVVQGRYDAAGAGRRMRGWNPPASGPQRAVEGLQKIRDRMRDSSRNDWSGESGLQKWVTNLVGVGIVPRLKKGGKAKREALTDLWKKWVKVADADCVLNFYGLQALATRSWLESGEVFVRLRPRSFDAPLVVPLQVQLVEADYVPLFDADVWQGMPAGNKIRQGIELNRYGRRVAYWMHREHPGDGMVTSSMLLRVPADQVSHVFVPTRPGQLRGVSVAAMILARLRNVENFDDAVLTRQLIANLFTAFITRPPAGPDDDNVDPITGLPYEMDSLGRAIAAMEPGATHELMPGEDVKFSNPSEAGTMYHEYMRTQHMGTASGWGLPYEIFSGDIRNVSDRTLRVVINEFRRFAQQRQWHCIIPQFCERVRDAWVEAGVMVGQIPIGDAEFARDVEWSPHGWEYIHPVQDAQGKQLEVDAGFRSRSSVIAERGDDPEEVDAERAADKTRAEDLGLQISPEEAAQQALDKKKAQDTAPQALQTINARLDTIMAREPTPAAAPSITVNNHVPPTQVSVAAPTVNVEPPNVQVAAPTVNVEAPNVQVAAPTVNVEAPNVQVRNEVPPAEVTVNLPNRRTETTVERNEKDQIVRTTQLETDA
jgi:lambda family phage portal protein